MLISVAFCRFIAQYIKRMFGNVDCRRMLTWRSKRGLLEFIKTNLMFFENRYVLQ